MTKPAIISRADWGARKPRKVVPAPTDAGVIVHHTTGPMRMDSESAKQQMRVMQVYHRSINGWSDVAYHYVIDGAGNIYEGRGIGVEGAHCPGKNRSHLGIALMGNFETDHPNAPALDALIRLARWHRSEHGYPVEAITGHIDHDQTLCPGTNLYKRLNYVRLMVDTESEDEQAELTAAVERMKTLPVEDVPITLDMVLREYDRHLVNKALFVVFKMDHIAYDQARDKPGFIRRFLHSHLMKGITEAVESHAQELIITLVCLIIDAAITSGAQRGGLSVDDGGVA